MSDKPDYCRCKFKDVNRASCCNKCGKPVEIRYTKPPNCS